MKKIFKRKKEKQIQYQYRTREHMTHVVEKAWSLRQLGNLRPGSWDFGMRSRYDTWKHVEFISEFLKASQEINWMFFRGK
jgi:hypothetical protein